MPASQEPSARADHPSRHPVPDSRVAGTDPAAQTVRAPSDVARPTEVDAAPQQASTQPDDGSKVPAHPTSFKDRVVGYAKITRGTTLRKPEVKELGEQILQGDAEWRGDQTESGPRAV